MDSPDAACELLLSKDPARVRDLAQRLESPEPTAAGPWNRPPWKRPRTCWPPTPPWPRAACLVLARPGWHRGVLGIVASRLLEATGRPTVLLAVEDGLAMGSGRSLPGFHLQRALAGLASDLVSFGGHELAAGLKLKNQRPAQTQRRPGRRRPGPPCQTRTRAGCWNWTWKPAWPSWTGAS